jgi:hypothetical protein
MDKLIRASVVLALAVSAAPAHAQATPLFTVAGVINSGGLGTFFGCTNSDTVAATIGVEVFDASGASLNNPTATQVSVAAQGTVLFGTTNPAGLSIDANLAPGVVTKGSAHILSISKKIACSAFVAEAANAPPVSMVTLTVAAKGKQKGD